MDYMAGWLAIAAIVGFIFLIPVVAIYIVTAYFMSKTFEKMGLNKNHAWIPIYNVWLWIEAAGYPGYLALLPLVTFVDFFGGFIATAAYIGFFVVFVLATARLMPRFGKPKEYAALALVSPILFGILGSAGTTYNKNA